MRVYQLHHIGIMILLYTNLNFIYSLLAVFKKCYNKNDLMQSKLLKFIIIFACFGVSLFSGIFLFLKPAQAVNFQDVLINEIAWMGNSDSSSKEWLELKNISSQSIDLTGWILKAEDGSPLIHLASSTLAAGEYYLLERTDDNTVPEIVANQIYSGALEDTGEILQLIDSEGQVIDLVDNSSAWLAGDKDNKLTMERKTDLNWQNSALANGTPQAQNSSGVVAPAVETSDHKIVINELLPNPAGVDDNEWIELKNLSTTTIDLINWKISDLANTSYVIKIADFATTTILDNGFFVLPKNITGLSLNNTGGETVRLFDEQNNLVCEISYIESAPEEVVWARDEFSVWHWSTSQTQNNDNIITEIQKETAGGGSGASYIKTYAQRFKLNEIMANPIGSDFGNLKLDKPFDQKKILNKEINSENLGEWIEIKSLEGEMFPLVDWKIKTELGEYIIKETDFKWPYLEAGHFFLLPKYITNLNLKNTGGEEIQLLDPTGKIVDTLKYSKNVLEGEVYMLAADGQYYWSKTATPLAINLYTRNNLAPDAYFEVSGEINSGQEILLDASESSDPEGEDLIYEWHFNYPVSILNNATSTFSTSSPLLTIKLDKLPLKIGLKVIDSENLFDEKTETIKSEVAEKFWWQEEENTTPKAATTATTKKTTTKVLGTSLTKTTLADIKELADGTNVQIEGVVAVLPGVLGVNIFYVVGTEGIQIYSSKKDWPELQLGERLQIVGELSTAYGERRIKIKDQSAITKIALADLPQAEQIEIVELKEDDSWKGSLIKIIGEITDIGKDYFWLDDGSGEIKVTLKSGTNLNMSELNLTLAARVAVSGIFSPTESGLRILPRSQEDIIITNNSQETKNPTISGQEKKLSTWWPYLLVFSWLIILILVILIWRLRHPLPKK